MADGNIEDGFKWPDFHIDDDGIGKVTMLANEGSSTYSSWEFEFMITILKILMESNQQKIES